MNDTLTIVCQDIRNWFEREKYTGEITIGEAGALTCNGKPIELAEGQYFRVIGSVFADGIHQYPETEMLSETFTGAVWAMAVPPAFLSLVTEIKAWRTKYEATDGAAMSPFTSESFGGYSYSKSTGGDGSTGGTSWEKTFATRLNPWRKL